MKKNDDDTLSGKTLGKKVNIKIDGAVGHTMLIAPTGTGMSMPVGFGLTDAEFDEIKANFDQAT